MRKWVLVAAFLSLQTYALAQPTNAPSGVPSGAQKKLRRQMSKIHRTRAIHKLRLSGITRVHQTNLALLLVPEELEEAR